MTLSRAPSDDEAHDQAFAGRILDGAGSLEPRAFFEDVLMAALGFFHSETGFLDEVVAGSDGQPALRCLAISDVAWDELPRRCDEAAVTGGLEFRELPAGHPPLEACLSLPIWSGGQQVGLLGVADRPAGHHAEHIAQARPLCDLLGSLILLFRHQRRAEPIRAHDLLERVEGERSADERARLERALHESERRERESEVLRDALEYLQSCGSFVESLEVLAKQAVRLFGGFPVTAYRFDDEAGAFFPVEGQDPQAQLVQLADCWGARTGRPHLSDSSAGSICCRHGALSPEQQMLCLPLLSEARILGLLTVGPAPATARLGGPPELMRSQLLEYGVLARQFALALNNVRLREDLHQQATEDSLTGLANRREFEHCLARELARWRRYHEPFSLLVLDVDHFKELNDRQGHTQGDRFLEALAAGWRCMVRTEDCLSRIGGDEFAVLLVQAGKGAAVEKAEVLRASAGSLETGSGFRCSVSVGVATVGEDGFDRDSLLRAADQALYRAKERGRDRVVAAVSAEQDPPAPPDRR
ncbi:MAG: GGDEF domain-containing protein [Planctomycetes bacterium]|nr:GGDEF domain-containing protein [Planctomycetota bacterium]